MHTPYITKLGNNADFRVSYHFLDVSEGGREYTPNQGYRSDLYYDHEEHRNSNQIFMIWPEFEDEKGNIILDTITPIPKIGSARMWILFPEMRSYHKNKIHVGLPCFFMEGSKSVAECLVIELVDILINPSKPITIQGKNY